MLPRVARALWVGVIVVALTLPPVRITATPQTVFSGADVTLRVYVRRHVSNRAVVIDVESAGFASSSEVPLQGTDRDPQFFERVQRSLPAGEYLAQAVVYRYDGGWTQVRATTRFQVLE
jgi:hypothetical protein